MKYKDGNVTVTFRASKKLIEDFDEEIKKWNEEAGTNFSRTDFLQVLVTRFLVGRDKETEKEVKTDNKNIN